MQSPPPQYFRRRGVAAVIDDLGVTRSRSSSPAAAAPSSFRLLPRRHRTASPDLFSSSSSGTSTPSWYASMRVAHDAPLVLADVAAAVAGRTFDDEDHYRNHHMLAPLAHSARGGGGGGASPGNVADGSEAWHGSGIALDPATTPSHPHLSSRSPESAFFASHRSAAMTQPPPVPPAPPGSLEPHSNPSLGSMDPYGYVTGNSDDGHGGPSSAYSSGWPSAPSYSGGGGGGVSTAPASTDPFPRFPFPSGDTAGITFAPPPASPDDGGLLGGANAKITLDKERKRIMQACEPCRLRKAKCNGRQPCSRCTSKYLDCDYAVERKMRGPNRVKKPTKPKEPKSKKKKGKSGEADAEADVTEGDTLADTSGVADSSFESSRPMLPVDVRVGDFGQPIIGPFVHAGGAPPRYNYPYDGPPPPPELGYHHQSATFPVNRQPPNAWRPMAEPPLPPHNSGAFVGSGNGMPSFNGASSTATPSQYSLGARGPSFAPPSVSPIYGNPPPNDAAASRQHYLSRTLPGIPPSALSQPSGSASGTPMLYQPSIPPSSASGSGGGGGADFGPYTAHRTSSSPTFQPPIHSQHRFSSDSATPMSMKQHQQQQPQPSFPVSSSHAVFEPRLR